MELDWSEQAPHIRSLYRPWQPGDGYDEATLQAAEMRLGVHLPATLRNFYLAWGRREDLTRTSHYLLTPEDLLIRANTLIFWAENQAVVYWGIPHEALAESDPPVVVTLSGPSGWEVESELHWTPSHAQLSGFLDDLTYLHALAGGAAHKGGSAEMPPQAQQIALLEEAWGKAKVTAACFGGAPTVTCLSPSISARARRSFGCPTVLPWLGKPGLLTRSPRRSRSPGKSGGELGQWAAWWSSCKPAQAPFVERLNSIKKFVVAWSTYISAHRGLDNGEYLSRYFLL